MQHGPSSPPTYPGSRKTCFSRKPVFGRKISLIFPIIYQIAHLHKWPISPLILPTAVLDGRFTHFGGFFSILRVSWLLNFIETRRASFDTSRHYKLHWNYLISHAKTSFIVNCAGGTQGVQLLDWSNKGQVWAIRLRWVWVTWHPSLWCWSLWIG